jgi:XTP/dITP diphosphohydrolase
MTTKMVLATANPHKVTEIEEILQATLDFPIELVSRPEEIPEVEETGATLEENARLKAVAICEATAQISVADDTGLFVKALAGAPGVYSARYAGEHASYEDNVAKLLQALRGENNRRATFVTVALAVYPDGREFHATGEVTGTIALTPRGNDGFGYDPIFLPDESSGKSFAELSAVEKHSISHRGRAFRILGKMLTDDLAAHGSPTEVDE